MDILEHDLCLKVGRLQLCEVQLQLLRQAPSGPLWILTPAFAWRSHPFILRTVCNLSLWSPHLALAHGDIVVVHVGLQADQDLAQGFHLKKRSRASALSLSLSFSLACAQPELPSLSDRRSPLRDTFRLEFHGLCIYGFCKSAFRIQEDRWHNCCQS